MQNLGDLFEATLGDIYYAEKKILKTLPKMARKVGSEHLKAAFESHAVETARQIARLEKIFALLGKVPRGRTCAAIDGILDEGEQIIKEAGNLNVLDAGLLAAAQAVEHYEMTRYGTLKSWAGKLGMGDAVRLLEASLKEETATDQKLTALAESEINVQADEQDLDAVPVKKKAAERAKRKRKTTRKE